eukprot:1887965-Rhodomonas_salina.1
MSKTELKIRVSVPRTRAHILHRVPGYGVVSEQGILGPGSTSLCEGSKSSKFGRPGSVDRVGE